MAGRRKAPYKGRMIERPGLLLIIACGCLSLASSVGAAFRDGSFTIRDAEFLEADRGLEAAQEFVRMKLAPGIPMQQARQLLGRADMRCRKPALSDGAVLCDFSETVHIEGGTLGEDHWTVRLMPDGTDRLVSAKLDHFTVGVGRPGL